MKVQKTYDRNIVTGQFREIVYIIPQTDVNDYGNISRSYNDADKVMCYANVIPWGNNRELQEAGLTFDDAITVRIRYVGELDNTWRLVFDNNNYTIHKIANVDSKNRFIELKCYTKTAHHA